MAYLPLLVGIAFAVLFYRAALYERMSAGVWTLTSIALTLVVGFTVGTILGVIIAQLVLFGVMWWYNANRKTDTSS